MKLCLMRSVREDRELEQTCEQSPEKLRIYAPRLVPISALLPASISVSTEVNKMKLIVEKFTEINTRKTPQNPSSISTITGSTPCQPPSSPSFAALLLSLPRPPLRPRRRNAPPLPLLLPALDAVAASDVAQCLYPEWRNAVEKPFLWLGDLHPYLFTDLLRSFLDDQDSSQEEDGDGFLEYAAATVREFHHRPWHVETAWRSQSRALTTRADQIECGLRLMAPAMAARARHAQAKLVKSVGAEWGSREGVKAAVGEAMEELVGVVVDANRPRRSVLADVLSVTMVYQAALFFEAVAQFLVGIRDSKLLKEFEDCEKAIN
ncbi:hypothetical protein DH2020_024327 [Rehmannia glutinosa]|uniref:DOG1 domain-containing protein n=1 Tax=Rehmannia glutinosa TaxID=99300 RepID=A0ABR0W753_REHGL